MKPLILALALLGVAALQTERPCWVTHTCDESNVPDIEKQVPPGDYCKRSDVTIRPSETHAHPCDCQYSCTVDNEGNVIDHESSTCKVYCKINGRRCTCWPEGDPKVECDHVGGNAIMNMDGEVIAVRKH